MYASRMKVILTVELQYITCTITILVFGGLHTLSCTYCDKRNEEESMMLF